MEKTTRCPVSGIWHIKYKKNRWSPPHRAYAPVPEEDPEVNYLTDEIYEMNDETVLSGDRFLYASLF